MSSLSVDFQLIFYLHFLTVKGQFMIITLSNTIYKTKSVKIKVNNIADQKQNQIVLLQYCALAETKVLSINA